MPIVKYSIVKLWFSETWLLNAMSEIVFSHGGKIVPSICLPTWRLTELEILLSGWPLGPGAAPLRYAHPATPTRNPRLPLYLYTRLFSPFSFAHPAPRRSSAAAAVRFRSREATNTAARPWIVLRYAAPCRVFLRPRLRRSRTRASHGSGLRRRKRRREELLLGGHPGGA